ncbi:MAG TPA: hypothetical protein VL547_00735 [Dinghuibacter sp.]|uniref:hypothetical protein n=1 Tax=Dinghuibacter sp. TaxID=2024697 RepID=UPI002CA995D7|nr:hypothetical protein [Dinghuibacter sp.]HTJ10513.1 hypothetical protein [Dinghuibacter sp.]
MKRLLPLLLCLGLFTQCRRHYRAFDIYFWSSDTTGPYRLYLDRHYAGDVPCIGPHTEKEGDQVQQEGLHHHLRSGTYQVDVYDPRGRVRFHGHLTILRRTGNLTISTDIGDTHIEAHGDAFLEEFYTKERPNS